MDTVLFEQLPCADGKRLGIATLNSEKSLNALTLEMIRLLQPQLAAWEADPNIAAVLLRGAGEKAFCAGGDVRALREALLADDSHPQPQVLAFFHEEYMLDYHIHCYAKPLIVWGHGIVMGGGLGLMAGASHRVATSATRIAMPEITIGLYPDVAGSWFLQRMPARVGLFLGLTGAPLNAHDALICNLADHVLDTDAWPLLLEQLQQQYWDADTATRSAQVSALLSQLEQAARSSLPASNVAPNLLAIHQLMTQGDLATVADALGNQDFDNDWLASAAKNFRHGCPVSAAVTWEIFQRARHLSLAEALRMELILSLNFCHKPDFREGVRALLVDKDRQPQWHYRQLADIPQDWVDSHFVAPWPAAEHPLASLQ
ncbi:enoyl-CoA hydratase [Aquitalea sp. FJL05]|uniref:enoyl-CoA hydratase/isomerase family protein n=1 Tax=Aquitalea TaxID=407217 RepID=UPI000F593AB4|nr:MULTISPECIES: enoyl-CoA hydratase/isomerase family protein [Aquitalea]RQO72965.1 enoyl-CoA hydratase [Aquitalea sp. FJL05]